MILRTERQNRCYDVGDRVHIYADTQTAGKVPTDVCVVKVNLLTTVFKRWDEQVEKNRHINVAV